MSDAEKIADRDARLDALYQAYRGRIVAEWDITPEALESATQRDFLHKRVSQDILRFIDAAHDAGIGFCPAERNEEAKP